MKRLWRVFMCAIFKVHVAPWPVGIVVHRRSGCCGQPFSRRKKMAKIWRMTFPTDCVVTDFWHIPHKMVYISRFGLHVTFYWYEQICSPERLWNEYYMECLVLPNVHISSQVTGWCDKSYTTPSPPHSIFKRPVNQNSNDFSWCRSFCGLWI